MRTRDWESALLDQLCRCLSPAVATVARASKTPWASATFSGARHFIRLTISGAQMAQALKGFERSLSDTEFQLDGHIVADFAIIRRKTDWHVSPPAVHLELEVLTVETDYRPAPIARRNAATLPIGIGLPSRCSRSSAFSSRDINPEIESSCFVDTATSSA